LTIDFQALGGPSALDGDWYTTPTGRWMFDNSWKYGWVLSYPLGEGGAIFSQATCFHYEPWHYRYLGREIARKVHRSGLTIREYLWKHHTMLDTNLQPVATPTPTPTPTPSPSPTPTASPTPSPTQTATPMPTPTPAPTQAPAASPIADLLEDPRLVLVAAVVGLLLVATIAIGMRRGARSR
jgi:D-alanyl-D-alanine carboxypeptidase